MAIERLVQRFSTHKTIVVQLEDCLADLHSYGEVVTCEDGYVTLRVPKWKQPESPATAGQSTVIDLTVEDPPIEEVIEQVLRTL